MGGITAPRWTARKRSKRSTPPHRLHYVMEKGDESLPRVRAVLDAGVGRTLSIPEMC